MTPKRISSCGDIGAPTVDFIWAPRVHTRNGISICAAVLVQLTVVINRQTDRQTDKDDANSPQRMLCIAMQLSNHEKYSNVCTV